MLAVAFFDLQAGQQCALLGVDSGDARVGCMTVKGLFMVLYAAQ